MFNPEAIISDADGTLVNTLHLIRHGQYETAKTYLLQIGIDPSHIPDYQTYEGLLNLTVGGSARDTLERTIRLLYDENPEHLKNIDFDELHNTLNPIQDRIAPEFVEGYDGLPDFLRHIGTLGIKFAIFTSGTPHHIVRNFGVSLPEIGLVDLYKSPEYTDTEKLYIFEKAFRDHFGISDFTIITCDDVSTHKPDPASLILAMQRLHVTHDRSLVLGDHTVDMQAAVNADVSYRVGITHGFNGDKDLINAGATHVIHSLGELSTQLEQ